jgi:hypothetical protein
MTREDVMKEFVNQYLFGDFEPKDVTNAILDEVIRLREENALLKNSLESMIDPYHNTVWR